MIGFQNIELGVRRSFFFKLTAAKKRKEKKKSKSRKKARGELKSKSEIEKSSKVTFKYVTRTKGLGITMVFSKHEFGEKLYIRICTTFGL